MAIITISRGSYTWGKEVAEKVAARLGYRCLAREVVLEASKQFNVPEVKLIRAIHDAPSILERIGSEKEQYVNYIRLALLQQFQKDNVVYHGLAGHFFAQGISHALKVRIISDFEDRVRHEMEREKITHEEAARILREDDEQRRKWSQFLYGLDTRDPELYDLIINIKQLTSDDAVEIICHAAGLARFQKTTQSQQRIDEMIARSQAFIEGFK
jgi:cytidylate kinase